MIQESLEKSRRKNYIEEFIEKDISGGKVWGSPYAFFYIIEDILFDASVSYWAYIFCQKIGNKKFFNKVFLTHSHYDHIGGVWVIKTFYPDVKIYGHSNIKKVLNSQNAFKIIEEFNRKDSEEIAEVWEKTENKKGEDYENYKNFRIFELDYLFNFEGEDIIDYKGVKCVYSPGHTRDTISFYIPNYKVFIASESMGVPNHKFTFVLPEFLSSYNSYVNSFERLKEIVLTNKVNNFLLPHIMYFEHFSDVVDFLKLSQESLKKYIKSVISFIEKVGVDKNNQEDTKIEEVFKMVLENFYVKYELIQPLHGFKINVIAQIKNIIRELM